MITSSETHTATQDGRGDSIRQIAILLHALPQRTHRVLLGQLGIDDKQCIAEEMSALGEIDAMEQVHVLKRMRDDLRTETSRVEKVESEIQDEIQIGRARVSKKRSKSMYRSNDSVTDAAAETHPESAERPTRPTESASAEATPTDLPLQYDGSPNASPARHRSGDDVVTGQAAMPPTNEVLQRMFAQFHQTQAAGVLPSALLHHGTGRPRQHQDDPSRESPQVLPMRQAQYTPEAQSIAEAQSIPETQSIPEAQSQPECVQETHRMPEVQCNAAELADRVDRFLMQLPPQSLCRALGMVSTKQAFLVLCGLPNETAETVLDMLPRRQSRKVRSDMRRMGQLQLSDIDAAKQIVAQIAIRFEQQQTSVAA